MFIIFILFWIIAGLILSNEFRTKAEIWVATAIFFFGFSGLGAFLLERFPNPSNPILTAAGISYLLSDFGGPISLLFFSLYSTRKMPGRRALQIGTELALAIPLVCFICLVPDVRSFTLRGSAEIQNRHNILIPIFEAPYYIVTLIFLLRNVFQESSSARRTEAFTTFLLVVPVSMVYYLTGYIIPALGLPPACQLNVVSILVETILFVLLYLKRNAFGLSFKFQNATREHTEKTIVDAAGVYQHAMKNNLLSIRLALQNARYELEKEHPDSTSVSENVRLTVDTCKYSQTILDHTFGTPLPLHITAQSCKLHQILEKVLDQSKPDLEENNVRVKCDISSYKDVFCDPIHTREAILNLISNAVDAMRESRSGLLQISVFEKGKRMILQIRDNGTGIEKTKRKIFKNPQPETSKSGIHYGLGLHYVQKAITMQKGTFHLRPAKSGGTIAEIALPIA